jgi:hypothetical protein
MSGTNGQTTKTEPAERTVTLAREHALELALLVQCERAAAAELELARVKRGTLVTNLSAAYAREGFELVSVAAGGTAVIRPVAKPPAVAEGTVAPAASLAD